MPDDESPSVSRLAGQLGCLFVDRPELRDASGTDQRDGAAGSTSSARRRATTSSAIPTLAA